MKIAIPFNGFSWEKPYLRDTFNNGYWNVGFKAAYSRRVPYCNWGGTLFERRTQKFPSWMCWGETCTWLCILCRQGVWSTCSESSFHFTSRSRFHNGRRVGHLPGRTLFLGDWSVGRYYELYSWWSSLLCEHCFAQPYRAFIGSCIWSLSGRMFLCMERWKGLYEW